MNFADQIKNALKNDNKDEIVEASKNVAYEFDLLEKGSVLNLFELYRKVLNELKKEVGKIGAAGVDLQLLLLDVLTNDVGKMDSIHVSYEKEKEEIESD